MVKFLERYIINVYLFNSLIGGFIMMKGFDGFSLKIIALILMVFDHIHYCFSGVWDIPQWFTMLGRLSAPLFIFMTAMGMSHTRNAKKYMLRLYIGSLIMSVGNQLVNQYFPLPSGGIICNAIFSTMFIIAWMIYCIQKITENKGNKKRIAKYSFILLMPILTSSLVMLTIHTKNLFLIKMMMTFFPSIITCEGGIMWVVMGVGFYLCRNSKMKIAIFYLIFCTWILLSGYSSGTGVISMFLDNIQWIMVFALPFILLYNDQKGKGLKYFFYIFYPAHIYLFTIMAYYLAK